MLKKRVLSIIFVILLLLPAFSACSKAEVALTAADLLSLGEKYLLEMNYEQALVQFLRLIEIEPRNPRGYTGLAEAYVGLGDFERAINALRDGLRALPGNAEIQAMLDRLSPPEMVPDPEPVPGPETPLALLAQRLIELYLTSGYHAVINELRVEDTDSEVTVMMNERNEQPFVYNTRGDTGCGFYLIGSRLYIYIGGYDGFIRSGDGTWLHANNANMGYYVFRGHWTDDAPNGEGTIITVHDPNTFQRQEGRTYALESISSGTFQDGRANGSVNMKYVMEEGHIHNWDLTTDNGIDHVIETMPRPDGSDSYVVARCTECDATLSSSPGNIRGVLGFISGNN